MKNDVGALVGAAWEAKKVGGAGGRGGAGMGLVENRGFRVLLIA